MSLSVDSAEIEVFLVLAEELHFGRTAQRLHLPQPRVSRLITRLERRTGGALFDRTSRRVQLTPLGEQLRARLQPAWSEVTAALEAARTAARGITGELRVGFALTTPSEPLNRLLAAFEARRPECRVILREHQLSGGDWDVWRPLREGASDVMVYWQAIDGEPDLTAGPVLARLDRVLLVARGHRLARRESISAEELAGEPLGGWPPSLPRAVMDMIVPPWTPSGRPIPRGRPVRSFHEALSWVARGRIVHPTVTGVVPALSDDVVAIPIRDLPPLPAGLIWCTTHENARIRALAAIAASIAHAEDSASQR